MQWLFTKQMFCWWKLCFHDWKGISPQKHFNSNWRLTISSRRNPSNPHVSYSKPSRSGAPIESAARGGDLEVGLPFLQKNFKTFHKIPFLHKKCPKSAKMSDNRFISAASPTHLFSTLLTPHSKVEVRPPLLRLWKCHPGRLDPSAPSSVRHCLLVPSETDSFAGL